VLSERRDLGVWITSGGSAGVFALVMTLISNIFKKERTRRKGKPECLWKAGIATNDITCLRASEAMRQKEYHHFEGKGAGEVYTDGSAKRAGGTRYAGWGTWSKDPELVACGPLKGYDQSAARAEVRAIVAAAELAKGRIKIISENKYAVQIANRIIRGECSPEGKHHDLWKRFAGCKHKVDRVSWIKSHMDPKEAEKRGFPEYQKLGNHRADELANQGAEQHGYTSEEVSEAERSVFLVRKVQKHPVRSYVKYLGTAAVKEDRKLH